MPKVRALPVPDRILDAAVRLMQAEGVGKMSQTQVARAAGVRQSHLTYYFPRKTDLMIAVARRSVEHLARDLADFFGGDGWPEADAGTRQRVMALLGFLVKDRERTRLVIGLMIAADDDPALRAELVRQVRQARALLARGLGAAADEPAVDIAMATLWGLGLQHLLMQGARPDDYTDQLLERLPNLVPAVPATDP